MIGEPLVLRILYRFDASHVDSRTGQISEAIAYSAELMIETKDIDKKWVSENPEVIRTDNNGIEFYRVSLFPTTLCSLDSEGLEYGTYSLVFMHNVKQGIIFEKAGDYRLRLFVDYNCFSPVLNITVLPVDASGTGRFIMSDPNDFHFLMGATIENRDRPHARTRVGNLIERSQSTLIAKWAAARLGLECFDDAEKRRSEARREKRTVDIAIWGNASKYLEIGLQLPDDFSVRQEVLDRLIEIECERKDYSKALLYVDELRAKYPMGRHGKKATEYRREILRLRE